MLIYMHSRFDIVLTFRMITYGYIDLCVAKALKVSVRPQIERPIEINNLSKEYFTRAISLEGNEPDRTVHYFFHRLNLFELQSLSC